MKNKEYYGKLVLQGREKKYQKLLVDGEPQEKIWIIEALGIGAKRSDILYNNLIAAFLGATEKSVILTAIKALGACGRSAAITHLDYLFLHTEDPQIKEEIVSAIRALKQSER